MRALVLLMVLITSCASRRLGVGGECELNSECAAPLVCRLSFCRNECATSADCLAGLSCVLDPQGFGACQLPAETSCTLDSECPFGLVCRFEQCTNACETDRDCLGGARCEVTPAGNACVDRSERPCSSDGECDVAGASGPPERCLSGRCRRECFTDRDCRNDFWCNWDAGGVCWPLPRVSSRDAGAPTDAADGGIGSCGAIPFATDWRELRPGVSVDVSVAAAVSGHLVFSTVTDFTAGPGGALHVLDTTTRVWSVVPFPASRNRMSTASEGANLYLSGGTWSTSGGDPYTDVATFDVTTNALGALSGAVSEARDDGAMVVVSGSVVIAGGNPYNAAGTGSAAIDVFDLASPGTSTTLSLPAPYTGIAGFVDGTSAYFAGGMRDLNLGQDFASDRLFVVDVPTSALRELAMPHFLASASTAVLGREAYVTGAHYDDGTTFLTLLDPTFDVVDVFDLDAETWRSIAAPSPPDASFVLTQSVIAGGLYFRALGEELQVLDLATGTWRCAATGYAIRALLTDGARLYVAGSLGGDLVVDAFLLP